MGIKEKREKEKQEKNKKLLDRAIKTNPKNAEDYFYRGLSKDKSGDHEGAIEDYTKAIEIDPNHAETYFNRGLSKSGLGDHQGSIEDYTKSIELDSNDAGAYSNRGISKGELGDYQGAIDDYTKAIEIDPNYANAYSNRGDHQGAIDDYTKAIEINPKHAGAYYNRGNDKHESGDHQGAIKDYDEAIKINPGDAKAYSNRGASKHELGDHQGAIEDYDKAIEIDPNYPMAYYNRGMAYRKLGQEDIAREDFRLAQDIDPTIVSEESTKKIRTEVKDIRKEVKEAEAFQKIIKVALKEYKRNSRVWLWMSIGATVIVTLILIPELAPIREFILELINYAIPEPTNNDTSNTSIDIRRVTSNIFILTILFLIIRQYSNAKKLAIETNNRLIASKLFNNVKNSDDDDIKPEVKETAYPKIIDAIVDSPYNQGHEGKSDNMVDKIINAWLKK